MVFRSLIFTLTGVNGITAKQSGAPGTSSSLPILIKYVCYYNSSITHQLGKCSQRRFFVCTTDSKNIWQAYTY